MTEILKSKVTIEQEKEKPSMTVERDTEEALLLHDTPRRLTERRQEDVNRALLGPLTPLPQRNVSQLLLLTVLSLDTHIFGWPA